MNYMNRTRKLEGYGPLQTSDDYQFEFDEGRQAFLDGLTVEDCPYPEPTFLNRSRSLLYWLRGYYAAFVSKLGKRAAREHQISSLLARHGADE